MGNYFSLIDSETFDYVENVSEEPEITSVPEELQVAAALKSFEESQLINNVSQEPQVVELPIFDQILNGTIQLDDAFWLKYFKGIDWNQELYLANTLTDKWSPAFMVIPNHTVFTHEQSIYLKVYDHPWSVKIMTLVQNNAKYVTFCSSKINVTMNWSKLITLTLELCDWQMGCWIHAKRLRGLCMVGVNTGIPQTPSFFAFVEANYKKLVRLDLTCYLEEPGVYDAYTPSNILKSWMNAPVSCDTLLLNGLVTKKEALWLANYIQLFLVTNQETLTVLGLNITIVNSQGGEEEEYDASELNAYFAWVYEQHSRRIQKLEYLSS